MPVEPDRIRILNSALPRETADYVLYWSQMNRRVEANHALAHAIHLANERKLPLLVYEGLTCTYRHANDRLHTFVMEAVPETQKRVGRLGAGYIFYLRARRSDANNVVYRLAERAASIVTDDYPTFIAAHHNGRVPGKIDIPYIAVDSSCIVPMSRQEKRAYAAYSIRPKIRRELPQFFKPLGMPRLSVRWRDELLPAFARQLRTEVTGSNVGELIAGCEIDHRIPPSTAFHGGYDVARKRLRVFLSEKLRRYAKERNEPAAHATSNLSPYLHFGQTAALEVALAVRDYAQEHKLIADEFLEELIVRRELAFNFVRFTPNPERLDVLPDWRRETMKQHSRDERPEVYSYEQFARAETHDALWNATQKEFLLRGKIHGYYRMYWGKKIIEWTANYEEALRIMIELHDIYALDGRDPNTYANILWCFGLHDRPWFERPVFGQLRYMSLEGMRRKTDADAYIKEVALLERTGREAFQI